MNTPSNLIVQARRSLLVTACLCLPAIPSSGTDRFWDLSDGSGDPSSGDFGTATNWDPVGVPGDNDWIILDREATDAYTINLDQDRTLNAPDNDTGLTIEDDRVVLDLNGHDLTFERWINPDPLLDDPAARNFLMGETAGNQSHFTLQGGGTLTANNLQLGTADNSVVNLTVRGADTLLDFESASGSFFDRPRIGGGELTTINVIDDGTLRLRSPVIGTDESAGAREVVVNVSDGGELITTGEMYLARNLNTGSATLNILEDGTLDAGSVRTARRGTAFINVDGGSAESTALNLSNRTALTEFTIQNGGTWQATTLNAGSREGAQWNPRTVTTITGAGSSLALSGNANLGETTLGTAGGLEWHHMNVLDGGQLIVDNDLRIRFSGRLAIANGYVQANNLEVGDGGVVVGSEVLFAEYVLTLGTYSDATAPLVLVDDGSGSIADLNTDNFIFTLELESGFSPQENDVFGVLRYEGALLGTFKDLPQDSMRGRLRAKSVRHLIHECKYKYP